MKEIFVLIPALLLLAGLLIAEKKESTGGRLATKPLLSSLFIVIILIQPVQLSLYYVFVLASLFFCLVGDICLVFMFNKKVFTLGLASFLIGHILYSLAFFSIAGINTGTWISLLLVLPVSSSIFFWLKPRLGSMLIPVIAYMTIISLMVVGAASLFAQSTLPFLGRALVLVASILFYGSDVLVARQKFVLHCPVHIGILG